MRRWTLDRMSAFYSSLDQRSHNGVPCAISILGPAERVQLDRGLGACVHVRSSINPEKQRSTTQHTTPHADIGKK